MRLAIVSPPATGQVGADPDIGPSPRIAEMSTALAVAGHEVRVFVPETTPGVAALSQNVPVVPVSYQPSDPADNDSGHGAAESFGAAIYSHLHEWSPDVIHAHHWLGGVAALAAANRYAQPVPVALTYHEVAAYRQQRLGERTAGLQQRITQERRLGHQVDHVIAQSRAEADALVRLGVSRQRMTMVPTGVDASWFAPNGPLAPRRPPPMRILTVGSVAHWEHRSGIADTLHALTRVPATQLIILDTATAAGAPENSALAQLRGLAQHLDLHQRVQFVDSVPHEHLPGWYRSADLVVCPSWYEPLGTSALEAMACGVPVVATAVGAHRDTMVDGLTGLLVPSQNPPALARAMRVLLADPVRRMACAAAARDRTRQCHAWERVAACLHGAYRQLCPAQDTDQVIQTASG